MDGIQNILCRKICNAKKCRHNSRTVFQVSLFYNHFFFSNWRCLLVINNQKTLRISVCKAKFIYIWSFSLNKYVSKCCILLCICVVMQRTIWACSTYMFIHVHLNYPLLAQNLRYIQCGSIEIIIVFLNFYFVHQGVWWKSRNPMYFG